MGSVAVPKIVLSNIIQYNLDIVNFLVNSILFTKSRLFTISTVILLHNNNKMGNSKGFTKPRLFTISTFTISRLYCKYFAS